MALNDFFMQFGTATSCYNKGTYCAKHPSYSSPPSYVYRSSDIHGQDHTDHGHFHHLILCKVILGNSWSLGDRLSEDLRSFAKLHEKMEDLKVDSVTGGPHQPDRRGKGLKDSIMYVDCMGKQVLPEFLVTY